MKSRSQSPPLSLFHLNFADPLMAICPSYFENLPLQIYGDGNLEEKKAKRGVNIRVMNLRKKVKKIQ